MPLLLASLLLAAPVLAGEPPLTNADVVRLVAGGVRPAVIIATIQSRPCAFQLGPEDLVALTKAQVPDVVLTAMLTKAASTPGPQEPADATAPGVPALVPDITGLQEDCSRRGLPTSVCRVGNLLAFPMGRLEYGCVPTLYLSSTNLHYSPCPSHYWQGFDVPWAEVRSYCWEKTFFAELYVQRKDDTVAVLFPYRMAGSSAHAVVDLLSNFLSASRIPQVSSTCGTASNLP